MFAASAVPPARPPAFARRLDRGVPQAYVVSVMRTIGAAIVLGVACAVAAGCPVAGASTLLDYVTFDGIDYIRWAEEPGRELGRDDLGPEFAVVECSFGEDLRRCPYGVDAGAAFLPSGTRIYTVRGYATTFRLAAVWKDRIFLYQAWRNPRARAATDLYDITGKVRKIDVRRGDSPLAVARTAAAITTSGDLEALVELIARGTAQRPQAHEAGEPRYWLTFWLSDGTTLSRVYFRETHELMGGVVVSGDFTRIIERYLGQ